MLLELYIKNLATIREARVEFGPGLNVITGETGAGKTMLVGSIDMLLGSRADSAKVGPWADEAVVQALFSGREEVLVTRRLPRVGPARCLINDELVTVGKLAQTTSSLVSLYGQHQQRMLLSSEKQLALLDEFDMERILPLLSELKRIQGDLVSLRKRVDEEERALLERGGKRRADEADLAELDALRPQNGEYADLENELRVLKNHQSVMEQLGLAVSLIGEEDGRAAENLAQASRCLSKLSSVDEQFREWGTRLESISLECRDLLVEITAYLRDSVYDPQRLEDIQGRLYALDQAARKRSVPPDSLADYWHALKERLADGQDLEGNLSRLRSEMENLADEETAVADKLTVVRSESAAKLQSAVNEHLPELGMRQGSMRIVVEPGREVGPTGKDRVTFYLAAARRQASVELAKGASGGELSRVMLALRLAEPGGATADTLVFDEIDAGISGKTAFLLAEKLSKVAEGRQAICVTHLPQVAAFGDSNILVSKQEDEMGARTTAERLDEERLLRQIAAMQSGLEGSQVTVEAARELLEAARSRRGEAVRV